jgi:hypothetical protein
MKEAKMRRFVKISLAILLLAVLAWASDPWKNKPYQQWDKQDVAKVLNDSPWTDTVMVTASWAPNQFDNVAPMPGQPGVGAGQPQMGAGGGASMGQSPRPEPGSQAPGWGRLTARQAHFRARWLSALTVRQALARLEILEGKLAQAQAERYLAQQPAEYEVVVFGPDMTPFQGMEEAALLKTVSLEAKKFKQEVAADHAKIERSPDGKKLLAITFSFPKTANGKPLVAAGEKEVNLICRLKLATLKFKFDPRKMKTQQGEDL